MNWLFSILVVAFAVSVLFGWLGDKWQNDAIQSNTTAIDLIGEAYLETVHTHEGPTAVKDGDTVCLRGLIQTEFDPTPFGVVICVEVTLKEDTLFEGIPAPSGENAHLAR